jgi:hypothetical protein
MIHHTNMTSLQGTNGFVDDGSAVIERVLKVKSEKLATSVNQLEDIYEIDRTVKVLLDYGFEKVDFLIFFFLKHTFYFSEVFLCIGRFTVS